MSELPNVTGSQAIKAFSKAGFTLDRISGSHHILRKVGHALILSIPVHGGKTLKRGTLRALINASGLTVQQFRDLL